MDNPEYRGRKSHRWRLAVAQLRRESVPMCHICGDMIDMTLRHPDPWSWQADHEPPRVVLVARGDDPDDIQWLRPSHRDCNLRKGAGPSPVKVNASRQW